MLENFVKWVSSIGWIGVDLFFVLSGFLISNLIYAEYERRGSFSPGRFLLRRGLKIWPAYLVAYGAITALRIVAETWKGRPETASYLAEQAVCNALFLQNYLPCARWSHSWSLAVEEHFYTVLALLLGWATLRGERAQRNAKNVFFVVVPIGISVMFGALILRLFECFPDYPEAGRDAYYQSHMRADALFAGVVLAYLVRYFPNAFWRRIVCAPVLIVCAALALLWPTLFPHGESPWSESLALTLVYVSFAPIVMAAALSPDFGLNLTGVCGAVLRLCGKLGVYSYTIYLGHAVLFGIPGVETTRQIFQANLSNVLSASVILWADRLAYLTLSILMGVALSKVIEKPVLRWRDRWKPPAVASEVAQRGI